MRACEGQLCLLDLLRCPGACPHEVGTYATKSKCALKGGVTYTNCREVGHCVWDEES